MRIPAIAGLLLIVAIIGAIIGLGRLATGPDCTPLLGRAKLMSDQAIADRGAPEEYIAAELERIAWADYAACKHQR